MTVADFHGYSEYVKVNKKSLMSVWYTVSD